MEAFLLENVPTFWLGFGMVVIGVTFALGGFFIVRRTLRHEKLVLQHDVAGFLIAVVGVIYAVLLAFMVIVQWEEYSSAETNAGAEAGAIGNLYRDAVALGPAGRQLRAATDKYAKQVAYVEWPFMASHQSEDPGTNAALNALWQAASKLRAGPTATAEFDTQAVADISTASVDRRNRVEASSSELPTPLWIVLLIGGGLTIGFCYFFSVDSFVSQGAMVSILATLISLSLFLILVLDLPFTGDVAVTPSALTSEINEFCSYNFVHPQLARDCEAELSRSRA
jgi:hypothetical protein